MKKERKSESIAKTIVGVAVIAFILFGGIEWLGGIEAQKGAAKVAQDEIERYEIVKRNGSPMEIYVHAGMVAQAFLLANDEENYIKWRRIEAEESQRAGIHLPALQPRR